MGRETFEFSVEASWVDMSAKSLALMLVLFEASLASEADIGHCAHSTRCDDSNQ